MRSVMAGRDSIRLDEAAQHRKIFLVADGVDGLRRLDDFGDAREARVVQQKAKGLEADLALADVLVAVDAGAERLLRVVEMERADVVEADVLFHLVDRARVALPGADLVAGG